MNGHPDQTPSWGSMISGLLVGAVLGAGIALLFAPKSGKETRDEIGDRITDLKTRIDKISGEIAESARAKYADLKSDLSQAVDAGRTAASERAAELRQQVGLD